jgi:hypothetical protein
MNYTTAYWARVAAWGRYGRIIQSGASLQEIEGARNPWWLAERRLRLTPRLLKRKHPHRCLASRGIGPIIT